MTRVATAENEAALLEMAQHATASQLERICRGYRRVLGTVDERPESLADEEYRPTTLRRALRLRDDACRFPGCTNRVTDAHHVVPWARGAATGLDNLSSLCRRHHRLVHEHGYGIEVRAGGELRFLRRDGSEVPATEMSRRPVEDDAVARLERTHAAQGLHIDAQTAFPRWDGTPVDYDLAVQALVTPSPRAEAVRSNTAAPTIA